MGRESPLRIHSKKRSVVSKNKAVSTAGGIRSRARFLTTNRRERSYTMPDWLINIVTVPPSDPESPTAAFTPVTQQVLVADNITWSNRTGTTHEVVPVSPIPPSWAASFGVNPVPAGESSNPTYSVIAPVQLDPNTGQPAKDAKGNTIPIYGTVKYQCKLHPDEF